MFFQIDSILRRNGKYTRLSIGSIIFSVNTSTIFCQHYIGYTANPTWNDWTTWHPVSEPRNQYYIRKIQPQWTESSCGSIYEFRRLTPRFDCMTKPSPLGKLLWLRKVIYGWSCYYTLHGRPMPGGTSLSPRSSLLFNLYSWDWNNRIAHRIPCRSECLNDRCVRISFPPPALIARFEVVTWLANWAALNFENLRRDALLAHFYYCLRHCSIHRRCPLHGLYFDEAQSARLWRLVSTFYLPTTFPTKVQILTYRLEAYRRVPCIIW